MSLLRFIVRRQIRNFHTSIYISRPKNQYVQKFIRTFSDSIENKNKVEEFEKIKYELDSIKSSLVFTNGLLILMGIFVFQGSYEAYKAFISLYMTTLESNDILKNTILSNRK